jgi:hypothetical protein
LVNQPSPRNRKDARSCDDAHHEAGLMVSEKVDAMFEAGASLMAGATPASIIDR